MVVGLTGGVGSGKSTILYLLKEKYNAYILEADKIAHTLMSPGQICYNKIIKFFGKEILMEDLTINRKLLADIVFQDDTKLTALNGIVHPAVEDEIKHQIRKIQDKDGKALIVIEAALLIEAGYREICDQFWYVYADISVRRERLARSRGYTPQKTEEIMNGQLSDEVFRQKSDYIIDNSTTQAEALVQIEKILEF